VCDECEYTDMCTRVQRVSPLACQSVKGRGGVAEMASHKRPYCACAAAWTPTQPPRMDSCGRVLECKDLLELITSFLEVNERWWTVPLVCHLWRHLLPVPQRVSVAPFDATMIVLTDLLTASPDAIALVARTFRNLRLIVLIVYTARRRPQRFFTNDHETNGWSSDFTDTSQRQFASELDMQLEGRSWQAVEIFLAESKCRRELFIANSVEIVILTPRGTYLDSGATSHPRMRLHYRPAGHSDAAWSYAHHA